MVVGPQFGIFRAGYGETGDGNRSALQTGGAFRFFKLPVGEPRDKHVALEGLWGNNAADLRERLLERGR